MDREQKVMKISEDLQSDLSSLLMTYVCKLQNERCCNIEISAIFAACLLERLSNVSCSRATERFVRKNLSCNSADYVLECSQEYDDITKHGKRILTSVSIEAYDKFFNKETGKENDSKN